ncbi:MAG: alpha/beta hydrolase [Actinomycetota bacterium]|nr:alpha/beta hydrolase [Actinomycetota bacterium]
MTTAVLLVGLCGPASGPTAGAAPEPGMPPRTEAVDEPATVALVAQRLAFAAQRYRTPIFSGATTSTLTYATAPDLNTGQSVVLQLDLYRPIGDTSTSRPLLVWVHGGAFAAGNRSSMASVAVAYARLGYVTASISYRIDPGSRCLQVQAGQFTGAQLIAEQARCERAIMAARADAAAAVAWLRTQAGTYGIDTTRVAIGGSSAGAITAVLVGQTLNTPGSPPPAASRVSAVLAMSGCNYIEGSIDSADAPVAMIASGGDPMVPYSCSVATVAASVAAGVPALGQWFELESGHAQGLYAAHQGEIDRSWRLFLIDHLDLV